MTSSDDANRDYRAAVRALVDLARCARSADTLEDDVELDPPSEGEVPLEAVDWLVLAAESLGLPLAVVEAGLDELPDWLDRGDPLLTAVDERTPTGRSEIRWRLVRGITDGRFEVAVHEGERSDVLALTAAELAEELGLEPGARVRWITTGPSLVPPAAAEASSSGEPLHPLYRLGRLVRPDGRDLFAVLAFALAIGVLYLATPVAVQAVVNFVAFGGALPPLIVVVAFLFLGLVFANLLVAMETWTVEILQRRLFVRTVADLATRLPRAAIGPRCASYGPELVNRYFDLMTLQKVGSFLLLDGLALVLSVLIGLVLLAFYHPLLLAFDVIILSSIVIIVLGPVRRGIKTAKAESSAKYAMAAWLQEIAGNPLMFKNSGVMKSVYERSDRLAREYVEARKKHFRIAFGQGIAALVLQVLASTALLGIGGLLVINGQLTLGQLVAAELVLTLVLSSVAKLGKHLEGFYDLMAATDKLGALLDVPIERGHGEHHFPRVSDEGAELVVRDLSWAPPGAGALFSGLSLTARPGERIGLRGPSGAGKSTLLRLVWGLLEPSRGAIRVDGREVRELSLESLRRNVALVDRIEVLDVSVRDNVRIDRPFVSDEHVRDALRRVGLLDDLARLPEGADTVLRTDGVPLSSGQVARLQVARAIASRPRLLLVSDIFEPLEAHEREQVFEVLFDPGAPWTLLFVSNTSEPLERCDRVYELIDGRLTEAAPEAPQPA